VAVAAWNYFAVTQDLQWLQEKGFPILSSVAEFWASRVEKAADGYHINNVVAADEWAENVDDNAFTNSVAKESLRLYNVAAKRLKMPENKQYTEISEGIVILKMDNNVTREHNRYNGENIKQADVNLLSYPLKTITDI
jgi:protein-glucosylgalactosylhydroxylysine glucosidase